MHQRKLQKEKAEIHRVPRFDKVGSVMTGLFYFIFILTGCVSPELNRTETLYIWHTLAGQPGGLGNVDGKGAAARFCQPSGVASDPAGNVYVADYYNYAVRKIAPDGRVSTLAGCIGDSGRIDGTGNSARFDRPSGVAADASGTLYVADSGSGTIRRVSPDGVVSTLAGSPGNSGYADGSGAVARFRTPQDVALDKAGTLYVADAYNHAIRKVTPSGSVTTLAGAPPSKDGQAVSGFADGKGSSARFKGPRGVTVDGAGNVYVADTENAVVRKVSPDGTVRTLAGSAGHAGYADGTNSAALFNYPQSIAVDAAGNLYVADTWNRVIRKVTPSGTVSTLTNSLARFLSPRGLAVTANGNLLVTDNDEQTVSLLTPKGNRTLLAGSVSLHGTADGAKDAAQFNRPCGIVTDGHGRLIVTDNFNHTLRRVSPDGVVTTFVGRAMSSGNTNGAGDTARFFWPSGAARDAAGNVYVADSGNHTLRKVAPDGTVSLLAGAAGVSGWADGSADKARFSWPADVAVGPDGTLVVADRGNHVIRRVTPDGRVSTLAGAAGKVGRADGAGGAARFNNPTGVAVDGVGNVYVADTDNQTVRKIMPGGEVTTLAGCAGIRGAADGRAYLARFNGPAAVAVDAAGNVFVADRDNHMIRRVTPDGRVTTLGGMPNVMDAADGAGTAARFAQPSGVALGSGGRLYVADACNNRIVVGLPPRDGPSPHVPDALASSVADDAMETQPYAWQVWTGLPGVPGDQDGKGQEARLKGPQGVALDADGVLYMVDGCAGALRTVTPDGAVVTRNLSGRPWTAPVGLAVVKDGGCFVTDAIHVLWKVTAAGGVEKVAGMAHQRGAADAKGDQARFGFIPGVAVDRDGNVLVADALNRTVRKVTPEGNVTTLAGLAGVCGQADGKGDQARFVFPTALAWDGRNRTAIVADGARLRRIRLDGTVTTLSQNGVSFGRLDGVAVDRKGNVYAADRGGHAIWMVKPKGAIVKLGGSEMVMGGGGWLMTGLAVDRAGNVYVADSVRNCIMKGTPQKGR